MNIHIYMYICTVLLTKNLTLQAQDQMTITIHSFRSTALISFGAQLQLKMQDSVHIKSIVIGDYI